MAGGLSFKRDKMLTVSYNLRPAFIRKKKTLQTIQPFGNYAK